MEYNLVTSDLFIEHYLKETHGWCSQEKAQSLIHYTKLSNAQLCVEIGVFGGASLIPVALAIKEKGSGKIVGIDPWQADASLEEMHREENKKWWGELDYEKIYNDFLKDLDLYGITEQATILRCKSEDVYEEFQDQSVDLLHIDGNHSEKLALQDSILYLPKVKVGGYIFYDDVSWTENDPDKPSTQKGLEHLKQYCTIIEKTGLDCLILQKIKNT